jgi:hypothetical protein
MIPWLAPKMKAELGWTINKKRALAEAKSTNVWRANPVA